MNARRFVVAAPSCTLAIAQNKPPVARLRPRVDDAVVPAHADPAIWEALASLLPRQRAVLILRYVDDRTVAEIADQLGLSVRATESMLVRARTSLRSALEKGAAR